MKITKSQLKRIIKEMHPRAEFDDMYVDDLEILEDSVVVAIRNILRTERYSKDVVKDMLSMIVDDAV